MKGRIVILDEIDDRSCAALFVDGRLEEIAIDPADDTPLPGAIYRAVAERPMKGQGGIFVTLPPYKQDEVRQNTTRSNVNGNGKGFLRQIGGVSSGQSLLVQVTGAAEPGKAIPVTTRILFKSRFCIITPGALGINVSRQIKEERLRDHLTGLVRSELGDLTLEFGVILRSACQNVSNEQLLDDLKEMMSLATQVVADAQGKAELLLDGDHAHEIALRDWLDPAPDEMITQVGGIARYGIDDAIKALLSPHVSLAGGASMYIEQTRALITVDVNTGGDTSLAAALKANIAAARELPRQLRLRGIGGQVVIDFAPISKKDRAVLDQVIKSAFKATGEAHLAGWTTLGLYEITHRRSRLPMALLAKGIVV